MVKRPAARSTDGFMVLKPRRFNSRLALRYLRRHTIVTAVGLAVIIIVGAIIGWKVHNSQPSTAQLNNVYYIEQRVSRHMLLPTNETPALATVVNHNKVGTPFLKQTKDGDKLLIYQKNHKVIIYRPSIDRIIDVGPVQIDNVQAN